jgi:transposase
MVQEEYEFYVGVDWATEAHQVCLIDPQRQILEERQVEHTAPGIARFVGWLEHLGKGDPGRVAVALEIPRGAVVEALMERGFHVFSINPKQLDRFRDRHTVAGAKDDRLDAFVLADSLRTDRPAFRHLEPEDPLVIQLRELSRIDEDLRQEMNRLANRLREQLHRFYPQMLHLCPAADAPWLWDLLEAVPTPAHVKRLRKDRVRKLLQANRIRKLGADEVLSELRTPPLRLAPGTVEAASDHVALLLPRLRLILGQRKDCARRIEALLQRMGSETDQEGEKREHRDVAVLRSFPGIGRVVAATMLAEASQPLAARDYHSLRAHAGVAPVTRRSGKRKLVAMRHACNPRLRNALYHWARVSAQHDPRCQAHYSALRQRGHTHGRALRGVADRNLRVLIAMLQTATTYDPARLQCSPAA